MNKKLLNFGALAPLAVLPTAAVVSCGKTIDSDKKVAQDEFLKNAARVKEVESKYRTLVISSLYGLDISNPDIYKTTFMNKGSELYKDSKKAFDLYAEEQINKDPYYFAKQANTWCKDGIIGKVDSIDKLKNPDDDAFQTYWKADGTGIREKVEEMILIKWYFFKNDTFDKLKKIKGDDFKDNANIKYEWKNYLLMEEALNKKMVQIWKSAKEEDKDDSFFVVGQGTIKDPDSFNKLIEEERSSKMMPNVDKLTDIADQAKLKGYGGFETNATSYDLSWDYDSIKNLKANKIYGYYDPIIRKLHNNEEDSNFSKVGYNPYKTSTNKVVVYVNQITPIGAKDEVDLKDPNDEKKSKKVRLLTFVGTPYEHNLDKLAYIFYIKDSSLAETALKAFAKQDYKLKFTDASKDFDALFKDKDYNADKE